MIRILNQFDHLKIIAYHESNIILDACNRTILLLNGQIIADGKIKEILSDKKYLKKMAWNCLYLYKVQA